MTFLRGLCKGLSSPPPYLDLYPVSIPMDIIERTTTDFQFRELRGDVGLVWKVIPLVADVAHAQIGPKDR